MGKKKIREEIADGVGDVVDELIAKLRGNKKVVLADPVSSTDTKPLPETLIRSRRKRN